MKTKVCVVTGSRADFGLLKWLMLEIDKDSTIELQIVVTGSHLNKGFGATEKEIIESGFTISERVPILNGGDTDADICHSVGEGLSGCAKAYHRLDPDLIIILGDRFEIFAAASAAFFCRIPIAHLMGGELSEGSLDDSIRHSISKMASLHFVANETYRRRVIQLGEQPDRVFNVGGMGVDALSNVKLLKKHEIQNQLDFNFLDKNLLITFHPATLGENSNDNQIDELLKALDSFEDTLLIFTYPNADAGNKLIVRAIEEFVKKSTNSKLFVSLGQINYLSLLQVVDAVIGNSSSGLAEAPSFGIPTVNIGSRQNGRLKAKSVIDCEPNQKKIEEAIKKCFDLHFREMAKNCENPYGEPGAAKKILFYLKNLNYSDLTKKSFFDIPFHSQNLEVVNT